MPTYSYACSLCDHAFDIRQSFTDDSLVDCPECFKPSLRKVIYPVGIAFKGSGFYRTDSKASAKPDSKASAPATSDSSGSSSGSTTSSDSSASSSSSPSSPAPAATPSTSSTSSTGSSTPS